MTSIATVNRMRCRSSGILKIFVNAEIMGANESRLTANNHRPPGLFNSLPRGFTELVGLDRQFLCEFAAPQNLQSIERSVDQPFFAQKLLRHVDARFELLEIPQVHQRIGGLECCVV